MVNKIGITVLLVLLAIGQTYAVDSVVGGVPYSAESSAMGMCGTAVISTEISSIFDNPSQLGNFARENNFSYNGFLVQAKHNIWGMDFGLKKMNSFAVGYNLKNLNTEIPISIGFSILNNEFNYGDIPTAIKDTSGPEGGYITGNTFNSYDKASFYNIAINIDYTVQLNIGYTYKDVKSRLTEHEASATMYDFGAQIFIPVIELIDKDYKYKKLTPYCNFTLGFAYRNIGDSIDYNINNSDMQVSPTPRSFNLGYSVETGLKCDYENKTLNLLGISYSLENYEDLINHNKEVAYYKPFTNLNIWNSLIRGKGNAETEIRQGIKINLLDLATFSLGQFGCGGFDKSKSNTSGYGFSTKGLFNIINVFTDSEVIKNIAEHFEMNYFYTRYEYRTIVLDYNVISFKVKGF